MKNLEKMAQKVWNTKDIEKKRENLLKMVDAFKHKDKQQKFVKSVETMDARKMDSTAANLALNNTDAVIR